MDSITHLTQKILAERARQQQPTPPASEAPPPYSLDDEMDSDSEEEPAPLPVKLTINAAHTINGSNNLIPTSPAVLQDATKFSTLLLHAVNQINAANTLANSEAAQSSKMRRAIHVDLTINCGVTVAGDRNVIGHVGVRPRNQALVATCGGEGAVVAGAKRKAEEDDGPGCGGPAVKKLAASDAE